MSDAITELTDKQLIEKAIEPRLAELGSDQYIFVMYDVKSIKNDKGWFAGIVINLSITLFQNIFYTLIKRTGRQTAKYLYARLLKTYLTQLPLRNVIEIANDLTKIGTPQSEIEESLQIVIEEQLKMLNPNLSIKDAKEFLNELGQQVLDNPPNRFNI